MQAIHKYELFLKQNKDFADNFLFCNDKTRTEAGMTHKGPFLFA